MKLLHSLLLALACSSLLAACASTGASSDLDGKPVRITYRDYRRGGQSIELVNESHTGVAELYSQKRSDAARKVQGDAVVAATVEHFDDRGFAAAARSGRAPGLGSGAFHRSLEVAQPSGTRYFATGPGSTRDDLELMNKLFRDFMELYNATRGYQVVDNPRGELLFDDQKASLEALNKGKR